MCTGGTASCDKSGQLTTKVERDGPSVAEPSHKHCQQTHEHFKHKVAKCSDCGLMFRGNSNLWYHIRTKHAGRRFFCQQCPCTFVARGGLNRHIKHVHEKLAKYRCETCGKGYCDRSNYYDHLATHSGTKRNICMICQAQFTFKCSLKVHISRFHPSVVFKS